MLKMTEWNIKIDNGQKRGIKKALIGLKECVVHGCNSRSGDSHAPEANTLTSPSICVVVPLKKDSCTLSLHPWLLWLECSIACRPLLRVNF